MKAIISQNRQPITNVGRGTSRLIGRAEYRSPRRSPSRPTTYGKCDGGAIIRYMTPKLTDEQRIALRESTGMLAVEDDVTHERYYLLDQATLDAMRRQADRHAIREGIADMEAGRVLTVDELDERIRVKLGIVRRP